jgi:hypothetical protein
MFDTGPPLSGNRAYHPFCLADRPNHVRILRRAAARKDGFGVLTQATVSETVQELIADIDVPVIVDCGVFAKEDFEGTATDLFERYEKMNADYGLIPDVLGDRKATDDSISLRTRLWERGQPRWSFEPVAVAQGESPAEYANAYWDCYQMGADRIAIGGLLSADGNRSSGHATTTETLYEILEYIHAQIPHIWESSWTFALGCDHPRRRPRFASLGVQAADSKRWLFQYDENARPDRDEQLLNEVLQAAQSRNATLTETLQTTPTEQTQQEAEH